MSELFTINMPAETGTLPPETYTPPQAPMPMPKQALEREYAVFARLGAMLTAALQR